MRPLTDITPKALAPFQGSTLIEQSISKLNLNGINTHVTVGYLGNILAETLIRKKIIASIVNTDGYDNGWWLFNSLLRNLNEPLLVMTCDNVTELDLEWIYNEYKRLNHPACMIVGVPRVPSIEGDLIKHTANKITEISRTCNGNMYASGIQVINPRKVNEIVPSEENFNEIWKNLIVHDALYVTDVYEKKWFSIDTLEQLVIRNEAK